MIGIGTMMLMLWMSMGDAEVRLPATLVKATWTLKAALYGGKPCNPPQPKGSMIVCLDPVYYRMYQCPDNAVGAIPASLTENPNIDWEEYRKSGGEVWCLVPEKAAK